MAFREVRSAQQAEITQLLQASFGSPKHSVRSASGCTTPGYARPRVPFLRAGLPTQSTETNGLTSQNRQRGTEVINRSEMHPH